MILQALKGYYDRLADDPESGIARPGFSEQKITFIVVLNPDGSLHEIKDGRREEITELRNGKQKIDLRATPMIVPGGAKPPGSGLNPGFLWDNTGYLLGTKPDDPKPERTRESFEAFRARHLELESAINDPSFSSVCRFLESWNPDRASDHPLLSELTSGFGVFKITAEQEYVHNRPAVRAWWEAHNATTDSRETGYCLITGEVAPLAVLHEPAIKGVTGAQSSGAKLVSFNCDAFTSYGKEQGANAPVSEAAAFAYCNALNLLLGRDRQRLQIGDATTVFWTDQPKPAAGGLPADELISFLLDTAQQQPQDAGLKNQIRRVLEKAANGQLAKDDLGDAATPFYVLGLSPNASRLSVRFWLHSTLGEITERLQRHIRDMAIVREWDETSKHPDPEIPSIWQLLRQTARESKDIPPLLGGALLRAILDGGDYPDALASAILRRIKADRDINYLRASALKAWLVRNHQQPIPPMLDETNTTHGYLLGRLFAALEKTQQDALGEVNAGIRDRFYASASSTPRAVFPRLLKTYGHHVAKLDGGQKVTREKLVQDVLSPIQTFPAHLSLEQQGLFALGYYHQRKAFYTRKDAAPTEAAA
jgi:CRISPR-associated protein Csd1